jgi:membrane fusion protein (multidrug efflux system)
MLQLTLSKVASLVCVCALLTACGGQEGEHAAAGETAGRPPAGGGFGSGGRQAAAVPVELTSVERRDIASYIETNGTLEAESEIDIVARTSGPIVELRAEENMAVRQGQLLARLDQDEIGARLEVSRVGLDEAETAFERAEVLRRANLLSSEEYEQARSRLDAARADYQGNEIQMGYTEIRAPFSGLIVERYVKFAETVSVNQGLFRLSDFDPLLCPIRVPERELPRLAVDQPAYLTVDAWPDERFEARVLRLSPVVDAATGTVKVTLEVEAQGKLRPGMFGSVFLQTDTREGALVIPKAALALDGIGDAVFVAAGTTAERRDVTLGVREGDFIEILDGVAEGDRVVSVGQDSLSDGTPIEILGQGGAATGMGDRPGRGSEGMAEAAGQGRRAPDGQLGGETEMTPERLAMMKQRMRDRGLSDEEIEQRLEEIRGRAGSGGETGRPRPGRAVGESGADGSGH